MTREEQILRDARGIGLTYLGEPPPEVMKLWDEGWLRRSEDKPHTYFTVVDVPDPKDESEV